RMNKISRRAFLGGTGAAIVVPACGIAADLGSPRFIDDNGWIRLVFGGKNLLSLYPPSVAPGGLRKSIVYADQATIEGKRICLLECFIDSHDEGWTVRANWSFPTIGMRVSNKPARIRPNTAVDLVTPLSGQRLAQLLGLVAGPDLSAPRNCALRLG